MFLEVLTYILGSIQHNFYGHWEFIGGRDAKRPTKKSAKPSNFNFLTNQRPATEILTNGITWREIHFGFLTNQRTIDISFSIPNLCMVLS